MPSTLDLDVADERLQLLADRAAFWPRTGTLLLTDTHWGKAASFRAGGVPVPGGTTAGDLARITALLARTGATRLIVLGDLFHARAGRTPSTLAAVAEWRAAHRTLDVMLVRGNHDVAAGDPPEEWGFRCVSPPWPEPPFVLCHHPSGQPDGYALAGHLHPGVRLEGGGGQSLKLPCFWFGPRVGVLPAFGSFTGLEVVRPRPGDRTVVVADGEVVEIAAATPPGGVRAARSRPTRPR